MKVIGNPFSKGDTKTRKNCREVSIVAMAAKQLNIKFYIVNAASHAFYLSLGLKGKETPKQLKATERRVLRQAKKIKRRSSDWVEEERYLWGVANNFGYTSEDLWRWQGGEE